MNKVNIPFEISVKLNDGESYRLAVSHRSETFDFNLKNTEVSIINNGDNSWSLVTGNLDQESVNLIGTEIEKYYQNLAV